MTAKNLIAASASAEAPIVHFVLHPRSTSGTHLSSSSNAIPKGIGKIPAGSSQPIVNAYIGRRSSRGALPGVGSIANGLYTTGSGQLRPEGEFPRFSS
jgi:hypothetical protein